MTDDETNETRLWRHSLRGGGELATYEVGAPTDTELRRIVRCPWWVVWDELGWAYHGELTRRDGVWWARLEFGHEDSDDEGQVVELRLGDRRSSRPILDELASNLGTIVLARYDARRPITDDRTEPVGLRLVSW